MREAYIHIAMREFLKREGWQLIAGEYPNGSDDELHVFSVMDPELARDNSPKPRKHSTGENVPDLIAYKDNYLLIIEAKSNYSESDKDKLTDLLENKRAILLTSLASFCQKYNFLINVDLSNLYIIPTLAFANKDFKVYDEQQGFAHIYVESLENVQMLFF